MATYKNGINGAFSGKVGTVVGATWRGINYMRGLPRPSNVQATDSQLAQRLKMELFRGFLLGINPIIEPCFQNYDKKTPMNSALSYNMKNAVCGTFPELNIDFPNLIYSKGDLLSAWSLKAESLVPACVDFSWTNGESSTYRSAADQVHLVVYSPEEEKFMVLKDSTTRSSEMIRLKLPKEFCGKILHCYISFYSAELKVSSTNEYLGEVIVMGSAGRVKIKPAQNLLGDNPQQ